MYQDNRVTKRLKALALLAIGLTIAISFFFSLASVASTENAEAIPQTRPSRSRRQNGPRTPKVDYKRFSHATHITKQKLACNVCHTFPSANWKDVRKGEAAFPDIAEFPKHESCLNCHRTEFFARERPAPSICSNCHVNVTPRDTTRFLFPSLGDVVDAARPVRDFESDFAVHFSHELHMDVITAKRNPRDVARSQLVAVRWTQEKKPPPLNCPICHQTYKPQADSSEEYVTKPPKNLNDAFWLKKGTFKTIPNSHTGCFSCHNADSGIEPKSSDCQVCHKLVSTAAQLKHDFDPSLLTKMNVTDLVMVKAWRRRISAGAFRHEGGAHPDLPCTDCHRPAQMNTTEPQTLKVAVRSCGGAEGCHITATSDEGGSLNFEIDQKKATPTSTCTKCHLTFGKEAIPANHLQAIPVKK